MRITRTRGLQRIALAAASTAMAVTFLSACAAPADGQPEPEPTTARDSAIAFTQCMRDNGIDMPDPGPDGRIRIDQSAQADPELFSRAQEACASLLGDGPQDTTGGFGEADKERLLALAACIRENGFPDFPDPEFGSGGQVMLGGEGIDPGDPAFQEAAQKCESEVGMPAPGGTP
jgi:hypothetical protein